MVIIGITGKYSAGKGTIAKCLGIVHLSVRDFITEYENLNPKDIDYREKLRLAGNKIRKEHGADFIIRELFKKALASGKDTVIESIRCVAEANFIKENGGIIWGVDADPDKRFKYSQTRDDSASKFLSLEDMMDKEKREESSNPNEQNLSECLKMANHIFLNNGTIKELHIQAENVYKTIDKEKITSGRERIY